MTETLYHPTTPELAARLEARNRDHVLVFYCHHGMRSLMAAPCSALQRGSRSGRVAYQFARDYAGRASA